MRDFFKKSSRGSVELALSMMVAGALVASYAMTSMQQSKRGKVITMQLDARKLKQANYAAMEIVNASLRSGALDLTYDTVEKKLKLNLAAAGIQKPLWSASGSTPENLTIKACSSRLPVTNGDLSSLSQGSSGTAACANNTSTTYASTVKVVRYVNSNGYNYIDVSATTAEGGQSVTNRSLMQVGIAEIPPPPAPPIPPPPPPLPPPPRLTCTLATIYNWNYGCGPGKLYYWVLYIPGGDITPASTGTNVTPNAYTKEIARSDYGRWDWGCKSGAYLPADWLEYQGNWYDIPSVYDSNGTAHCTRAYAGVSPLIVDMSGKGYDLSLPEDGPLFDFDGLDSTPKTRQAWPRNPEVYFLTLLDEKTGRVESIKQLFGNNTIGPDKLPADNGFDALKKHLGANASKIGAKDAIYQELRLWSDRNQNGLSEDDELFTLEEMGIAFIDMRYTNVNYSVDHRGSSVFQASKVTLTDGSERSIVDLWPAESHQQ